MSGCSQGHTQRTRRQFPRCEVAGDSTALLRLRVNRLCCCCRCLQQQIALVHAVALRRDALKLLLHTWREAAACVLSIEPLILLQQLSTTRTDAMATPKAARASEARANSLKGNEWTVAGLRCPASMAPSGPRSSLQRRTHEKARSETHTVCNKSERYTNGINRVEHVCKLKSNGCKYGCNRAVFAKNRRI